MNKISSLYMALAASIVLSLSACGGGGGGGGNVATPGSGGSQGGGGTGGSGTATICPDGSAIPATGTKDCKTTTAIVPSDLSPGSKLDPHSIDLAKGVDIPFSGTLDKSTVTDKNVVLTTGEPAVAVPAIVSLSDDGKSIIFTPVQYPAFGQSYTLSINVLDSVGNPVQLTIPFTTMQMSCTDTTVWSNPATFSTAVNDCVSPIGVQVKFMSYNKVQDTSCTLTAGSALTAACKAYDSNGTFVLANTSIVVGGHSAMWLSYMSLDGSSNVAIVDTTDPANPVVIDKMTLVSPIVFMIGNPTGAFVHTVDGKGSQLTVNSSSKIVMSCVNGGC